MAAAYSDNELLRLTLELKDKLKLKTFIETGTYHGDTAKIVSGYFDKIITVENNPSYYEIAKSNLNEIENCNLYFGNSPEIMNDILEIGDSSIFFFLDAHWDFYWPLLDELKVIKSKGIKPVIAIHDFYVPDEYGNPKFGFDTYRGQPLNFEYIREHIQQIYGDLYEIKYSTQSEINSGVIYIIPTL